MKSVIQIIATGQGDDYKSGCLLDYAYFKGNYKLCHKSKQYINDPKEIYQISCTGIIERSENTVMFFIFEEVKET